jgi:hypothetical protein
VVRGTTAGESSSGTWCRCWTPRPRLTRRCPSSSARWTIILPASTASGTYVSSTCFRIYLTTIKLPKWTLFYKGDFLDFSVLYSTLLHLPTKYVHIKSTTVYAPRRNWDSPQPPTRRLVCPLPPVYGGRGTLAGQKGVGRVPIPTRRKHCGTLYMYVLCASAPQILRCWDRTQDSCDFCIDCRTL